MGDENCWLYSILRLFPEILKNMEFKSLKPSINEIIVRIRSDLQKYAKENIKTNQQKLQFMRDDKRTCKKYD